MNKSHQEALQQWNSKYGIKRAKYVSKMVNLKEGKLLDIAGYHGDLSKFIPNRIEYTLIDLEKNNEVNSITWNLNKFPLPINDNEFDIIIALDILQHIKDPEKLLNEIKRICKKNGFCIISLQKNKNGHQHEFNENLFHEFKIIAKKGIIFGLSPILIKVPSIMASEVFFKLINIK